MNGKQKKKRKNLGSTNPRSFREKGNKGVKRGESKSSEPSPRIVQREGSRKLESQKKKRDMKAVMPRLNLRRSKEKNDVQGWRVGKRGEGNRDGRGNGADGGIETHQPSSKEEGKASPGVRGDGRGGRFARGGPGSMWDSPASQNLLKHKKKVDHLPPLRGGSVGSNHRRRLKGGAVKTEKTWGGNDPWTGEGTKRSESWQKNISGMYNEKQTWPAFQAGGDKGGLQGGSKAQPPPPPCGVLSSVRKKYTDQPALRDKKEKGGGEKRSRRFVGKTKGPEKKPWDGTHAPTPEGGGKYKKREPVFGDPHPKKGSPKVG